MNQFTLISFCLSDYLLRDIVDPLGPCGAARERKVDHLILRAVLLEHQLERKPSGCNVNHQLVGLARRIQLDGVAPLALDTCSKLGLQQ
jgi:hypothetical protein